MFFHVLRRNSVALNHHPLHCGCSNRKVASIHRTRQDTSMRCASHIIIRWPLPRTHRPGLLQRRKRNSRWQWCCCGRYVIFFKHSVYIFCLLTLFSAAAASAIFIILFSPFDPVVIARLQEPPLDLSAHHRYMNLFANPLFFIRCGRSLRSLRSPLVLSRLRMRVQ
jgi:hypothetical protein